MVKKSLSAETTSTVPSRAEMYEGPDAFDRFKKAMRTIVSVPKAAVVPPKKAPAKRKRAAKDR
jgi:hypothetical protein